MRILSPNNLPFAAPLCGSERAFGGWQFMSTDPIRALNACRVKQFGGDEGGGGWRWLDRNYQQSNVKA